MSIATRARFAGLFGLAALPSAAGPRALVLQPGSRTVGRFERIDFTIRGMGDYANPFDPSEVDLALEIAVPGGTRIVLPGFYEQAYERRQRPRSGRPTEWLYPADRRWSARFAPMRTGRYRAVAVLRDRQGEARSGPVTFQCTPSRQHGFLRASRTDPRYLEFTDRTPFVAIGQNAAFVRDTYDQARIFQRMAAAGGNFCRVWTCCEDWAMALEARKSAWGRSWDWHPPIVEAPEAPAGTRCIRVAAGDAGATASPTSPLALRPATRYAVTGQMRADAGVALSIAVNGPRVGEPVAAAGEWTAFRREFTTGADDWWLDRLVLQAAGQGAAWVRDLSLREAAGGPELLWEADVNRPVLGRYNPADCRMLDSVVEAAGAAGVRLQLCLLTRDLYMERLRREGPEYDGAIADARNLLRYAVARWGYSTSVAAWEYFNEIDPGVPTPRFYAELGRYLERTDPYHHLRATSDWADCPRDWQHPQLDVANMHYYLRPADGPRYRDEVTTVMERARTLLDGSPARPAMLAEFGLAEDDWQRSKRTDDDAAYTHLHNALWTSALSGLAGTVLPWWWEDIDAKDAYRHYRPLATFAAGIPFTTGRLRPTRPAASDPRFRAVALQGPGRCYLWLSDSQATWYRRAVERATPQQAAGVSVTVDGLAAGAYRVEWWDTSAGKALGGAAIQVSSGPLRLQAPAFTGDIACKIVRR